MKTEDWKRFTICLLLAALTLTIAPRLFAQDPDASLPPDPLANNEPCANQDSVGLHAAIDEALTTYNIPGAAVAAVKFGKVVWSTSHGFADPLQGTSVTDSTSFMIASISKPFVATAVMQLVEDGLIDLDEDIDTYLPINIDNPWHPSEPITTRMLLAHMSSISSKNTTWKDMITYGEDSPVGLNEFLTRYLVSGGDLYELDNFTTDVPGTEGEYSNVGYTLAAYIVQVVSGQDFEEYCQENIFQPLGMDETSWYQANLDTTRVAMPCTYEEGAYVAYGHYGFPTYPCGQLRTSSRQMIKFMDMFLRRGENYGARILLPATTVQMTTLQYPGTIIAGNKQWGLGWFYLQAGGEDLWGHTGGLDGVATYLYFNKDNNYAFIVMTNIRYNAGHDVIVGGIWNYVRDCVAEAPDAAPVERLAAAVPNPFNPRTSITYEAEAGRPTRLSVYDVAGRLVRVLVDDPASAGGRKVVIWDGRDDRGFSAAAGVYFYRLETGSYVETKRMAFVK